MLLLLMTLPLLLIAVVVVEPLKYTPLVGRLAPAGPMLLLEMVLLSLPFAVDPSVLKKILPPFVVTPALNEPEIVALVIVLFVAPLIKRIVLVPDVAEAVVLAMV